MTKLKSFTGLGLVASGKRRISSGTQYDHLYNKSGLLGTNPIVADGDTYDTLNQMANIVRSTLKDTERVAPTLAGRTLEDTLRNVWNHVYNHYQYEKDANGIEQIRRPSRSWADRKSGIDCDCMSVVISSLLHHLGRTDHALRKAAYNEDTGFQHVYVVVPKPGVNINSLAGERKVDRSKYYVLDCVVDQFDYEVPFIQKFDKVMKIQYLNGLDFAQVNGGVTPQASMLLAYPAVPSSFEQMLGSFGCEFNGLEALGDAADAKLVQGMFLRGLKQHLINTRAILAVNPALTAGLYQPQVFTQRLDALIAAFDDANKRTQVLNDLARLEDAEGLNGLNGPMGNVFKKIGQGIKKVAEKVGDAAKKVGTAVVTAVKAVAKVVVRYNPATMAIRNGLLLAMKLNVFRLAEKLGYGYWTEEQALSKGLDVAEWKRNKDVLEKARKLHKGLGGKVDKFDAAVKDGWKKGVEKHKLPTLGNPGTPSVKGKIVQGRQVKIIGNRTAIAKTQVAATLPLLKLVSEQLTPVQYNTLLRTNQNNELNAFMQAVRTNYNGIATKLSLAYKPAGEAKKYDVNEYKKLLESARNTEKLVIQAGGTAAQLRDAVEAGKKIAIKQGLGAEPVSTTAASSVIATITAWLKKLDFKKLFKGKATSDFLTDEQMKNAEVTAEFSEDEIDEGDPNAPVVSLDELTKSFGAENIASSNPVVGKITDLLQSNPKTSEIATQIMSATGATKTALINANPNAARLVDAIKANPVATSLAASVLEKNPSLANLVNKVKGAIQIIAPTSAKVADQLIESGASAETVDKYTTPGIVPIEEDGKIKTVPASEADNRSNNTVKYIAIAGGVAVGGFLLYNAFKPKSAEAKTEPAPAPAPALSGVTKKNHRTRKVMAITIN